MIRRDPSQDVATMILPPKENSKDTEGFVRLIDRKIEHGPILGYMPKPFHDPGLQSALKRYLTKTR